MNKIISKELDSINLDIFKQLLSFNLNVKNEFVLIIGDRGLNGNVISPVISKAFKKASDELGLNSQLVLGQVALKGENTDKEILKKLKSLPANSVLIVNMSQMLGKLGELGLSFRKFCQENNHRFISASSLGVIDNKHIKTIVNSYDIDYKAISQKANKIKKVLDKANQLNITSPAGTDLTFNINGVNAIVSDGIYQVPGTGGNLPGSEVYMAPKKDNVEGTIVIDGSIRTRKGTVLVTNPVEMKIIKGTVVAMNDTKESRLLEETLRWAQAKAKHPWGIRRIAEFGIGLNPKAKVIGCTVVDEKTLGTGHFAIGSNYWFGGSIYAIIHLDHVFHKPKIKADGKLLKI